MVGALVAGIEVVYITAELKYQLISRVFDDPPDVPEHMVMVAE